MPRPICLDVQGGSGSKAGTPTTRFAAVASTPILEHDFSRSDWEERLREESGKRKVYEDVREESNLQQLDTPLTDVFLNIEVIFESSYMHN